ncbi:MAG: hypothetical protein WKF47_10950 [Geodermatophilaceae bacterium]
MLPAVVVDGYGTIGPSAFSGIDLGGAAVLLLTGWTCTGAPTDTATQPIRTEYGAVLVGIDSVNIDDTTTGHRPAHTALLRVGIPVVEHLTNLSQPPATWARFTAVPR